jgi:hypothetical protein
MIQMGTQTTVSTIPNCDVCANAVVPQQVPAYADAKLNIGPWANVCRKHFEQHGCSLGTGRGQELILRTESSDQTTRIKDNLKGVDMNNLSFEDFEEIFEDRDPAEFL